MVTMSQKSSVPQAAKSVSQALMPDNGIILHAIGGPKTAGAGSNAKARPERKAKIYALT
jgi:hypothetical protein